jgi:phage terminase large subunit
MTLRCIGPPSRRCSAPQPTGTCCRQGRRAIWAAVNPHTGKRRIHEAFPKQIVESVNENEMFIRFKNGSTWTVTGSDAYDSLVGSPPAGIVFSEWSRANPAAWGYIAPILVENKGWSLFITTPLGSNHAHSMFTMARNDPKWFAELSTVENTNAISLEAVEQQRKEYRIIYGETLGDALIEQEFYCSFSQAVPGAYYAEAMNLCEREARICQVNVDKALPVHSAWDLGIGDSTAIWCFQVNGPELQIIDYFEDSGHGAEHYCAWLNDKKYRGVDWLPRDARVRESSSGRTRVQTLQQLGRKPRIVPDHSLMDGIQAGRITIGQARFDAARCARPRLPAKLSSRIQRRFARIQDNPPARLDVPRIRRVALPLGRVERADGNRRGHDSAGAASGRPEAPAHME